MFFLHLHLTTRCIVVYVWQLVQLDQREDAALFLYLHLCGQPSDRGRLKSRTENLFSWHFTHSISTL